LPYASAESPEVKVDVVYNLVVDVRKSGYPVADANVIVLSKRFKAIQLPPLPPYLIPEYFVAKTGVDGKAYFSVPDGEYLILADDGTDWRAYRDGVRVSQSKPVVVVLKLVEKREARYYLKLYLTVDVAPYLAPIVQVLLGFVDMFITVSSWILSPLGITIPGEELAKHVDIERVEGVRNELTIWIKYTGSPLPQAVVQAIVIIATFILLSIIATLVFKWAFGEELPTLIKLIAIAVSLVAISSIVSTVATVARRRE